MRNRLVICLLSSAERTFRYLSILIFSLAIWSLLNTIQLDKKEHSREFVPGAKLGSKGSSNGKYQGKNTGVTSKTTVVCLFGAIVVLTQLEFENGEPLVEVEYD